MKIKKLTNSENVVNVKLENNNQLFVGDSPIAGAVSTIVIDLNEEQADVEKQIDIRETADGKLTVNGADPGIAYAANIIIPPARYEEKAIDELDETGEKFKTEVIKLPIDTEEVQIILWPLQYPLTTEE